MVCFLTMMLAVLLPNFLHLKKLEDKKLPSLELQGF
jgi:hypothetical protein